MVLFAIKEFPDDMGKGMQKHGTRGKPETQKIQGNSQKRSELITVGKDCCITNSVEHNQL